MWFMFFMVLYGVIFWHGRQVDNLNEKIRSLAHATSSSDVEAKPPDPEKLRLGWLKSKGRSEKSKSLPVIQLPPDLRPGMMTSSSISI
jgi:hypothetical protein